MDILTNKMDIITYNWDFRHYIALAEEGFAARPLFSPYAYRYPTPFIAAWLSSAFNISTESGFKVIAYFGAVLQLSCLYFIVHQFTKSKRGAYIAVFVTAFSLFNVKFLMFDVFRPDHLAYALVLLCFYLAVQHSFYLLLIVTVIGVQFREFVLVPLLAYLLSLSADRDWKKLKKFLLPSLIGIAVAVILPRILIPVTKDIQSIPFSLEGIRRLFRLPTDHRRNLNFVFSVLAYTLPTWMLLTRSRLKDAVNQLPSNVVSLLVFYTLLVLLLSFYGGADLVRFVTYLFLPQALLVGLMSHKASKVEIAAMIIATVIFNKIWANIPIWDFEQYLDFYSGQGSRLNSTTALRFGELFAFIALGIVIKRLHSLSQKSE